MTDGTRQPGIPEGQGRREQRTARGEERRVGGAARSASPPAPATSSTPHTLYLVSTPIGNLEDITLRALRVLRQARLIAAEDTRHTAKLLARYDVTTPMMSYHEHNKLVRLDAILAALDAGDVALVADAGTPGLADPGYELVRAAIARGNPVVPVPGASALLAAVVAAGLVPGPFTFFGFPPRQTSARRELFARAASSSLPTIFYEAPHRLVATLRDLLEAYGERQVVIARELTKLHEELRRESLAEALAHFQAVAPRGEFVLILAGKPVTTPRLTTDDARDILREQLAAGRAPAAAAKETARLTGHPRDELYAMAVELRRTIERPVE